MNLTTYKTAATSDTAAIARYIQGMREAGWVAVLRHDGEDTIPVHATQCAQGLSLNLAETEEAWLYWRKEHEGQTLKGTMYFIFGNSPWEVLADSSVDEGLWDADLAAVEKAINLEGV